MIKVDQHTCKKDGFCAATCPTGAIDFKKGEYPKPIDEIEDICISCGHCVAVCPAGSMSHRDMSATQCPPINEDLQLSAEQAEQFLRSRRSIRVYKNKPVPQGELEKLIELAGYAPSGHNTQGVEWLVVGNKDELKNLSGIVVDWMRWMIENMSEFALSLSMDRAVEKWENGYDVILRDAPHVVVAHAKKENVMTPTAATISMAYLELAAVSMGLGCCWAGYFSTAATTFPPMKKALSLPDGHKCLGSMMVGYPKYSYKRLPLRNAPGITWRL